MPIKISLDLDDLTSNLDSQEALFNLLPKIVVDNLGSLNNLDEFMMTYKVSENVKLRFKLQEEVVDGKKKMVFSAETPISLFGQPKIIEWVKSQREKFLSNIFSPKT